MKYDVDKMIMCTVCQKCGAKPTKTPLIEFLLPNNLLWVPEMLYCPGCGNYVTIQVREMTKEELKEKEKDLVSTITVAEAKVEVEEIKHGAVDTIAVLRNDEFVDDPAMPLDEIAEAANRRAAREQPRFAGDPCDETTQEK